MTSNAATVYKFSDLKLQPLAQLRDATDVESGNEVRGVQWEKLHDNPEAWGCSFVRSQYCRVSATIKYRLLPDYAPVSQKEKKKREEWVWLTSVSLNEQQETQILEDGYYFYSLEQAQKYCETASLMICTHLDIPFPDGASIMIDKTDIPVIRHRRVLLADGTEVNVSDFGWHEFYVPSYDSEFLHSPAGWMQVRPTVRYLDANNNWKSAPMSEVRVLLYG